MPIRISLTAFLIGMWCSAVSQPGIWTWVNGDTTYWQVPVHGAAGIYDSSNHPSGGYEGVSWTGKDGLLWYFESHYRDAGGGASWGSELWCYDPSIEQWAWVKGPDAPNHTGHYGIQGVEDPENLPPARGFGAASWTDTTGKLWMFGGYAYINDDVYYADLWRYDPATNNWTWMSGPQQPDMAPVWGIQGVPAPSNQPGSRQEMIATWVDHDNDLWLFGGLYFDNGLPVGSDLWKYSVGDNMWTWMKGPNTPWSPGSYGIRGVEDPQNSPGARFAATTWTDSNGDLWLFGGKQTIDWFGNRNDMWRYRPATNNWTWMNGPPGTVADTGTAGLRCEEDDSFSPSSRYEAKARWTDAQGNLWLWGGQTGVLDMSYAFLNDLWRYDVIQKAWSLMAPDAPWDATGHFGVKGVPDPCNKPYGTMGNCGWYRSATNTLYLFGGYQYRPELPSSAAVRSLMWRVELDTNCVVYECPYGCDGLNIDLQLTHAAPGHPYGGVFVTLQEGYAPYSATLDGQPIAQWDTLSMLTPGMHELMITDVFGCSGTASFVILNSGDTGISIHQEGGTLVVNVAHGPIQLQAYDARGRIVLDSDLSNGQSVISIAAWAQGIYCFRSFEEGTTTKIFIQQPTR